RTGARAQRDPALGLRTLRSQQKWDPPQLLLASRRANQAILLAAQQAARLLARPEVPSRGGEVPADIQRSEFVRVKGWLGPDRRSFQFLVSLELSRSGVTAAELAVDLSQRVAVLTAIRLDLDSRLQLLQSLPDSAPIPTPALLGNDRKQVNVMSYSLHPPT